MKSLIKNKIKLLSKPNNNNNNKIKTKTIIKIIIIIIKIKEILMKINTNFTNKLSNNKKTSKIFLNKIS